MTNLINWWGVLLCVAYSMTVGAIWYSRPVFGRYWEKAAGVRSEGTNPTPALVLTAVLAAVTAAGVSALTQFAWLVGDVYYLPLAVSISLLGWLVFAVPRMTTHYLFEDRRPGLIVLNAGNELVTLVGMGAVIGLCGPAGMQ